MTILEFSEFNRTKSMPQFDIGQGFGYKCDLDKSKPEDIIYIPEYAYEDETINRENAFSWNDFVELCDGDEEKAEFIFNDCDWQYPTTCIEDWKSIEAWEEGIA